MDNPLARSPQEGDRYPLPIYPSCLRRQLMLTALRDWCMSRLSRLSLSDRIECCRALTEEHLELLQTVDQSTTLWMLIEPDEFAG